MNTSTERPQAPDTTRIRCDQNRIFGCGRLVTADVTTTPIGVSATGCLAIAWCDCGLPLSKHWTLYPTAQGAAAGQRPSDAA